MDQTPLPKWEAKVSTTLTKAKPNEIWLLFKDFFNIHKYFPTLATSYGVHGTNGEPGCIRYAAGSSLPSSDGYSWSKERLVAVDDVELRLSYEIVECNIGFKSYVSTVQIVPSGGDEGCVIEWSITVDPVEGWVFGDLVKKYDMALQMMAKKMEEIVLGSF
ncbi:hypothetical protein ACFE04_018334 [Oxalis oulophora]